MTTTSGKNTMGHRTRTVMAGVGVLLVAAGCSGPAAGPTGMQPDTPSEPTSAGSPSAETPPAEPAATRTAARLAQIEAAVIAWQNAPDLESARSAAEAARNLIVGAAGPYYGDADGSGSIDGAGPVGLLPGRKGEPALADDADGACVVRDVLGGSWADPAARWAGLDAKIEAWTPANNQFPTLPSHPQRIVGWATLALRAGTLSEAVEYAGHARLHSDISLQAVTDCRS
ncbi:MAG: hypothetical protein ABIO34_06745 [Arthrobacter oryzae]